jgi:leucine-rich repeat-containing protein 16
MYNFYNPFQNTLLPLLGALGSARGLNRLDISGNGVGDPGARLLARALRLNTSLKHLTLDRNHLTHKGRNRMSKGILIFQF